MALLYAVEVEPEVRTWPERLPDRDFGRADFLVGLLAERAADLGEPCTRHLGGKVRELRFRLLASQPRVTYWLAPGRRVILLTVFRKTRSAEAGEVTCALQAQKTCEAEHGPAHEMLDREVREKGEPHCSAPEWITCRAEPLDPSRTRRPAAGHDIGEQPTASLIY